MARTLVVAPAVEPVTLEEAKEHLEIVDFTGDDEKVRRSIRAAREWVEAYLGRQLVTATWDLVCDRFPSGRQIEIPLPPLQSVTHVRYVDDQGDEHTLDAAHYIVDGVSTPGRIVLKNHVEWPAVRLQVANAFKVRFVAGYGSTPGAVPEPIRQALLVLVATFYAFREDQVAFAVHRVPFSVRTLLGPYRMIQFA